MDNDLISRQAAIDALIKWYGCEPSDIGAFENIIEKLPSAQPERKKGKWIKHEHGFWTFVCVKFNQQFIKKYLTYVLAGDILTSC